MLTVTRQLPRIRVSNPLARGLVFAYLPGTMVNLVRPHEVARVSGVTGQVQNSLRMFGGANNGLTLGTGGLLGPLSNSTVVGIGTFTSGYRCIYGERGTTSGNEIYKLETGRLVNGSSIPGVQFTYRNSGGDLSFTYVDKDFGTGQRLFAAIKTGSTHEVWAGLVGRPAAANDAYGSLYFGGNSSFTDTAVLRTHGFDGQDPMQPLVGTSDLLLGWNRSLSIAELQQLRSDPSQLIEWSTLPVFAATTAAVPATLSGTGAALTAAYGALSSAIPMGGTAQVAAAGVGTLSTSIPLSGAATVRTQAAGALSTSIALAGAATSSTTATGALAGGAAPLAGVAVASAGASGALSTSIRLAGAGQAQASATGTLAVLVAGLSGAARAEATATGALSTGIRLAGSAIAQASASGALSTSIPLKGAAAAVASAYGALASKITLGGAAEASAAAKGALSVGKPSAPIGISKVDPARVVVFEGSGSRIVVFEGSGKRLRFDTMSAKKPTLVGTKWVVDRDPDEQSYYAADITDELLDRYTTLAAGGDAIELILQGVTQLEDHSVQVETIDGVERTYIVVLLGGVEGDLPKEWLWSARVRCANRERFDKTTWFNRVDT